MPLQVHSKMAALVPSCLQPSSKVERHSRAGDCHDGESAVEAKRKLWLSGDAWTLYATLSR